jgi:hypothetical protein
MIAPIDEVYANESGTLTIYPFYNRGSLKDYIHRVIIFFNRFDEEFVFFRQDQ